MAAKGVEIHELGSKLRIIAEALVHCGMLDSDTPAAFARHFGINYNRLKFSISQGRLTRQFQEQLATAAGFDPNDPAWLDPDIPPKVRNAPELPGYPGRDSLAHFRTMYFAQKGVSGLLKRKIEAENPRVLKEDLAYFSIDSSGQVVESEQPIELFATVVVQTHPYRREFHFGFKKVRLKLAARRGAAALSTRLRDVMLGDARLTVRGTQFLSEWFLERANAALDGEYATRVEPLCRVVGANIGDKLEAELDVNKQDGSIVFADGAEMPSAAKRKVLELLLTEDLPNAPGFDGWKRLAVQHLTVVRGGQ